MTAELDIVIPVYNEGANILAAMTALKREVRTPFRVLICYDMDEDNTLPALATLPPGELDIAYIKNPERGPHAAVRAGLDASTAPLVLVYMADDDYNADIVDKMVAKAHEGFQVVAASRFVPGGCMVGCSPVKEIITKVGAFSLYHIAGAKVHDPTNAFRLFTRQVLDSVVIESRLGFTFSVELLVKSVRLGWPVTEVAAKWFERGDKPSRFQVFRWLPRYLYWLFYAMETRYLFKGPGSVPLKTARR
ncbi:hypothetical protein A6A04_02535 [Paramagnetospirillum marisnigri]|uniref:Glycosyltransferase 2-like domain-containing protein n=1 Tax=Paramagnetospirillum marisnigri TaxID=1285242 RepID=A0A178MQE0_9PROT|nr:glycosyltransferase family 2 protein [Paramagnetospirillum marisnigri]OAN50295.1 hypothetical protein A6A04_02535 [Paramagnetospirillum marisnigri]